MEGKSPHILNAAANLLGFSFVVLTSIRGFGLPHAGFVDESVAAMVVIFSVSCLLSFMAIRSRAESLARRFEGIAEYVFLGGLFLAALVSTALTLGLLSF